MFLTSITLMANPSSPLEVIHFLLPHQSLGWVEAHILTTKWLWHQISTNHHRLASGGYIFTSEISARTVEGLNVGYSWTSALGSCETSCNPLSWSKTAIHPGRRSLPVKLSSCVLKQILYTDMHCSYACKQMMQWHKSTRKQLYVNTSSDPMGFLFRCKKNK